MTLEQQKAITMREVDTMADLLLMTEMIEFSKSSRTCRCGLPIMTFQDSVRSYNDYAS